VAWLPRVLRIWGEAPAGIGTGRSGNCRSRRAPARARRRRPLPTSAPTATASPRRRAQVAINFVPSRDTFLERLAGGRFTDATALDMAKYVAQFRALLGEVHAFLDAHGLDDPAKV
jgi:hypothetical protein